MALTGWAFYWIRSVFPVKYELDFYISDEVIIHSHRRENFRSYIALISWAL
jgi:hypothetical protein